MIPLSLVHKEVLRDLDVRDEQGNALPVLTREQNAAIAGALLVQQASVTLEELGEGTGVNEELQAYLKSIAGERAHEDAELVSDGERLLQRATEIREAKHEPIGRFQLEAALQAAHAARVRTGMVDWPGVLRLTEALNQVAPTLGARVAAAAARGQVEGPEAGLAALDRIEDPSVVRFQPAWATRARLLVDAGRRRDDVGRPLRAAGCDARPEGRGRSENHAGVA